jgi:AAA15 family ATPase/GTPase
MNGTGSCVVNRSPLVLLGVIEAKRKKEFFIQQLNLLCPGLIDLLDIRLDISDRLYANLAGKKNLIPFVLLGNSIYKLFKLCAIMLCNPGSTILVDGIDDGFHHTFSSKLATIIETMVADTGCQLIATTQSYDFLDKATATFDEDLFSYVRLDNVDGNIVAKEFDSEALKYAFSNSIEVR